MNNDDVTQKLALLPEGLAERNLQSWNDAIKFFEQPMDAMMAEHFPYGLEMRKVALAFSQSGQAKLFRAEGIVFEDLHISTTDASVKIGEPYLIIYFRGGFLTAQYGIDEERNKYH